MTWTVQLLQKLVRKGVPPSLRGAVWWACSGGAQKMHEAMQENISYPFYLAQAHAIPSPSKHDIEQDIHRTFPNDEEFTEEKLTSLRNILLAYSMRNREVGYCQGVLPIYEFSGCLYNDAVRRWRGAILLAPSFTYWEHPAPSVLHQRYEGYPNWYFGIFLKVYREFAR